VSLINIVFDVWQIAPRVSEDVPPPNKSLKLTRDSMALKNFPCGQIGCSRGQLTSSVGQKPLNFGNSLKGCVI